jgi:peroxiredoxin Q/BCP
MANVEEGQAAPDFELPRAGGGVLKLSDLRGRKVVLYFYPKDDTSGCTVEAQDFSRLLPEFETAGTVVIGMSPDGVKKHDKFRAKHELTVDLVSDETTQTLQEWGLWVEKSMYGRKYMGVDRSTFLIGPDGKILQAWRNVKVPGHAQEVLEAAKTA